MLNGLLVILLGMLMWYSWIDIKTFHLSNWYVFGLLPVMLWMRFLQGYWLEAGIVATVMFAFGLLMFRLGIGGADVKLLIVLSIGIGTWIFSVLIIGLMIGLVQLLLTRLFSKQREVPLIPAFTFGLLIVMWM